MYSQSRVLPAGGMGPCATRVAGTSETKAGALLRLALVPGGMLIGSALGIAGALRLRPLLCVLAAVILFLESVALIFSFAPVTLLGGALFLLAARDTAQRAPYE